MIEAFHKTQEWIENEENQYKHIWKSKKLPFTIFDLNIRAILLDEHLDIHK